MSLFELAAMKPFVLCSVALALKMFLVAFGAPILRLRAKAVINAEDTLTTPGAKVVDVDGDAVQRWARMLRNDLENIPMFWIFGLLFVLTDPTVGAAWAYFGMFTAARIIHSASYALALQPFRTLAYGIGVLTVVGLMWQVTAAVL